MKFLDFLSGMNKRVLGYTSITKSLQNIIDWVCKSLVEENCDDGEQYKFKRNGPNGEKIECEFNTEIGAREATFTITGLRGSSFWEKHLNPEYSVTVKLFMIVFEDCAFNNHWKLNKNDEIIDVIYGDGKFVNTLVFTMKSNLHKHGTLKGKVKSIDIFAKGGNFEEHYPIFSSKGKLFKDVKYSFTMDPWPEMYNMNEEKETAEQKEHDRNFEREWNKKHSKDNQNTYNDDNQWNDKEEAPRAKDHFTGTDYYKMLGVKQTATTQEIRKAYREIIAKVHPDVSGEYYLAEVAKKINSIKDVLLDPVRRKDYDNYLRANGGQEQSQ